jgi:hypothetical protein
MESTNSQISSSPYYLIEPVSTNNKMTIPVFPGSPSNSQPLSSQRCKTQTPLNDNEFTVNIIYRNVKIKRKIKFEFIHNIQWLIKKLKEEIIKF